MSRKQRHGRITEDNVDGIIQDLIDSAKTDYIVQSIAFNKSDQKQIALLRHALINGSTFGGYIKDLLTEKCFYSGETRPNLKDVPVRSESRQKDEDLIDSSANNFI